MRSVYRYESILMMLGDLAIFIVSLWLSLAIRYVMVPEYGFFLQHLLAFVPLFILWICLYVLGGLYDRHLRFSKSKLPGKLWMAQTINVILAFVFFYTLQASEVGSGITPKTILIVYLIVSGALITLTRIFLYSKLTERRPLLVVCIGNENDVKRFADSKEKLKTSGILLEVFTKLEDFDRFVKEHSDKNEKSQKIDIIVSNSGDKEYEVVSRQVYELLFNGVVYMDLTDFYEEVFEMIPLQAINESWFLKHVSVTRRFVYDALKRLMDIIIALPGAIFTAIIWCPIVYIAIKFEDKGPVFIFQDRIGELGKTVKIIKFRSMKVSDAGKWVTKNDDRITKVGNIIRKTRIDEFPQFFNILKGDMSLIGPRPEMPALVDLYNKEIPHYHVRHLIKPGLSGWAQIHHDIPPHSIEETKVKLSYDLYYIKNRGLILDLKIAFATIKTLLSRTGI